MITKKEDIVCAIDKLGLTGKVICLHSSLKSFGYIEGGANSVIQAFLDKECTLVVPTFTYESEIAPPKDETLEQNGFDYKASYATSYDNVYPFDKNSIMISRQHMGAIPAKILGMEDKVRGDHPINSFTAIGLKAQEIIQGQRPLDVYAPFRKVYDQDNSFIVLIGVDFTSATPIHFAEQLAGRRLFRRWAKNIDGKEYEVQVGSCSQGFNNLNSFIAETEFEKKITVGDSLWRVYPFRNFINNMVKAIKENPMITHCDNKDCLVCNDAVKGGPAPDKRGRS